MHALSDKPVSDSDQEEPYKSSNNGKLGTNLSEAKARNEATWEGTCHGKNPRKKKLLYHIKLNGTGSGFPVLSSFGRVPWDNHSFFTASHTSLATSAKLVSRNFVNGRGNAVRANTSLVPTLTAKQPLRGLSKLTPTVTAGSIFAISAMRVLADRPNTPQDLHASINTIGAAGASSSTRLRFGGIR